MRVIFLGPFGLRSGWRASLWWVGYLLVSIPVAIVFGVRPTPDMPLFALLGSSALVGVLCLPLNALFTRFLDHRPFAAVGLAGPPRAAFLQTLAGMMLGGSCMTLCLLFLLACGVASIALVRPDGVPFLGAATLLFFAAANEEFAFRGYPFQWLVRGMGFWPATILCALFFGVVHLANEGITVVSFANICLASILLSMARVVSKGLWFPIGLHFGWNAMQGMVLGVPVSGIAGIPTLARTVLEGSLLWTGGGFGFEGSIGGLLAVLAGIATLVPFALHNRVDWRLGLPDAPKTSDMIVS